MFQRFLSKRYDFYDLFDRHAKITQGALRALLEALKNPAQGAEPLKRVDAAEHAGDEITHQTHDLLHATFITPLDREEILRLISKLDDILDFIDAAGHRMDLFEIREVPGEMVRLGEVLVQAQDRVAEVVHALPKLKKKADLARLLIEINRLENEGDQLHRSGIAALFHDYKNDPLMVIKLKEVYEILEIAIDLCEDVADVVESIVLEHS